MAAAFLPLGPLVVPCIAAAQPRGEMPQPKRDGWIGPVHCPYREDRNPSLSFRLDSETDPGAFKDHATGESGSMADLAAKMGIDPRISHNGHRHNGPPPPAPELTLPGFCQQRALDQRALVAKWRVREVQYKGRPALQFPTVLKIDRVKYLDGRKPKAEWTARGGGAHWYGLTSARTLPGPLYIANGEPSVWSAQQAGVAAVCLCVGEGTLPTPEHVQELATAMAGWQVYVVYDLDLAGRKGATALVAVLRAGNVDATALELPAYLGDGGDVDDLHRATGADGLAMALASLTPLVVTSTAPEPGAAAVLLSKEATTPWPVLDSAALYGPAGAIVQAIEPHTEADVAALLFTVLVLFGSDAGHIFHALAGGTRHTLNTNIALVGDTAKGRKGSSLGYPKSLFAHVDPIWCREKIVSGLSSGEGIIYAVRDASDKKDKDGTPLDTGVADKRLMVVEEELASVLKVMAREGNTLSAVQRQAWDSGDLRVLNKNSPLRATGAHISLIGHITRTELQRCLTETEVANGYANRILWICSRRSKELPDGGGIPEHGSMVQNLHDALEFAQHWTAPVQRDAEARELWHAVYGPLSSGKPGMLGAVISRAEAHVLRLSLLYAALDCSTTVKVAHLQAALACWDYAEASARYIFGERLGDPIADAIVEAVREAGPDGLDRTSISALLGRNVSASRLQVAVAQLLEAKLITATRVQTAGAPRTVYHDTCSTYP